MGARVVADNTKIEWADATLNYVNGCSVLSPGCTNCYAMKQAHRFPVRQGLTVKTKGGMVWTGEVRDNDKALQQAFAWKRGRRIFWNAHGDLFHESVPDEWIDRLFAVCAMTRQHTHMILTKRSARMRAYFDARREGDPWAEAADYAADLAGIEEHPWVLEPGDLPLRNVWLGVSVEDQQRANERIPDLLATPAAVRFISAEPLLGPVSLAQEGIPTNAWLTWLDGLDWVIAGGESGHGARPMHPDWARILRNQCEATGVAFHFKQWGEFHPADQLQSPEQSAAHGSMGDALRTGRAFSFNDQWTWKIGKKLAGRLLDGVEHNEMPAVAHV